MEDRYIGLQIAALVLCMMFTILVHAQRQASQQSAGGVIVQSTPGVSQETRDALQDARLGQVSIEVEQHSKSLENVTQQLYEVNSTLARLNGIGFGFGSLLTALLALDVYFRVRAASASKLKP